jgi:hypothetical protein
MSRGGEIELELLWKGETAAAYLVEDANERDVWLPKSQVEPAEGDEKGMVTTFLVPEWLAIEKGLV